MDTQWNDVLREKGIIPPKKDVEMTEEDIVNMVENTIQQKSQKKGYSDMNIDELNENEDDIDEDDERMFEEYRRQRLAELKATQKKAIFGDVREISRDEYVDQVNKAGENIWVVLLVYKQSIPLCKLIEQYFHELSRKFPATKFLKSISSVCIPNYPDKNLPTIFIYQNGELKQQFVGPLVFGGMKLTKDELEWMLSDAGAIKTDLEERPRKETHDVLTSSLKSTNYDDDDDD
ncbi:hypothetical protein HELRODRAFT_157163 [Helobdella robusta]|uniref:Phosducin domain-containing protein n=1 Tax=Helobdella robusta TaxID=6412 RepID=T1EM73_HELRO|nr:hypothetical protein HELRODRAFT_157163 [Helobdella robusta]ESO02742.1 hypothetical protein HELRODRAFT_157163 [Helobdella robusta]